ncbi:MAG: hypothetical protein Q9197_006501 [Variospora fuerteventurae]
MPILLRHRFYPLDFLRTAYLRRDRRVFGHAWLTEGRPTLFSGSVLWGSRDEEEAVKWMTPIEVDKWGLVRRTEHTVEVLPAQRTGAPLLTEEDNLFQPAGGGQPILPAHQNQLLLPASQSQPFLSPEGNYHLPLTTDEVFQPLPGMSIDEYQRSLFADQDQRFLPTGQNQPVLPTQEDHTLPLTIDEYLGSFSAVPTDQDRAFLPIQEDHTLPLTIDEYLQSFSAMPTHQDQASLPTQEDLPWPSMAQEFPRRLPQE